MKDYEPAEVETLLADPTNSKKLKWEPRIKFEDLVKKW